jgi:tol-pal system protein YbgF
VLATAAGAAVPVQESSSSAQAAAGGAYGGSQAAPGATEAADNNSRLSELFYQLQVLQQEVQDLRGLVEEQNFQLNRLARDQQEQYLDLDRRMQALRANAPTQPPVSGGAQAGGSAPSSAATAAAASGSERDAYAAAFNLMKERQFEASADAFNQLVVDFPNGAYTPNAFYWLGELYLAQDEIEKARQSFVQVVNLYPDHQKVPDALYKLGVVYHRLGDVQRAREYLNRVRSEYPQSSAAGLAQTYLAELQ